jgi:hypothetical protein
MQNEQNNDERATTDEESHLCNTSLKESLEPDGTGNDRDDKTSWPQIVVSNVQKKASNNDIAKFLNAISLKFRKVKKVPQKNFCFIFFEVCEFSQLYFLKCDT